MHIDVDKTLSVDADLKRQKADGIA